MLNNLNIRGSHVSHRLVLVALFGFSLLIYVSTMSRGITWLNTGADGGDFITAARVFGVPHPTGYPTYTLLLRAFGDVVAFGEHAFRANLLSAVLGALTVPFVYVAAARLLHMLPSIEVGGSGSVRASAMLAALSFASSRLFWTQSTVTEVYTLNALFGAVLLVLTLGVVEELRSGSSGIKNRTLMTVLFGLGLGNHVTLVLAGIPFGLWILWLVWRRERWRGVFDWRPIAGLVLGLSVYVYVPVAASANPLVSWGAPNTFEGFRWMASASIYQPYAFGLSSELLPGRISKTAELLFTQFTFVGTVIGIAGLTSIWTYCRGFVLASVAAVLSIAVYAVAYNSLDSFIYLISGFMLFSLWIAVGVAVLGQGIKRYAAREKRIARYTRQIYVGLFVVVAMAIPAWSVLAGWDDVDVSGNREPADFARSTISVAAGGIVLAEEPQLFALTYQAQVEDADLDVMVIGPNLLQFDWYWDQLVEYYGDRMPEERGGYYLERIESIVAMNIGVVPLYSTHNDRKYHELFKLVPEGDLFRMEY
ncbi:MAG: DUF2723 domain-containing protein [Chloroflexi bacterium]|nr:DUF2723 domain-containing protein [Chloroflexota bacterium]